MSKVKFDGSNYKKKNKKEYAKFNFRECRYCHVRFSITLCLLKISGHTMSIMIALWTFHTIKSAIVLKEAIEFSSCSGVET